MGAWGFQAFENDDALDWLEELEAGRQVSSPSAVAPAMWNRASVPWDWNASRWLFGRGA